MEVNSTRFREIRRTLLGLITAFAIVTVAGVAVFYIFPTFFSESGPGWSVKKNDKVAAYYLEEELPGVDLSKFLETVNRDRKDVVEKLNLTNPPDRIRIYLHKDLSSLRTAISQRKSSSKITTPLATVDLIYGTAVKPLLVRVLTQTSWGPTSSEFLMLGLQQVLTDQVDHPHVRTAALKEEVFTLREIDTLENVGEFPRTLHERIYDYFDSPQAPAGMNLSQLSSLMRSRGGKNPYRHELELESASFVSYLINNYGIAGVRSIWKSNSFRKGVEEVTGNSLTKLGENWLGSARDRAEDNPQFRYFRSLILYKQGKLPAALNELKKTDKSNLNEKRYLQMKGKIHFYRGNWSEAGDVFSRLNQLDIADGLKDRVSSYLELVKFYRGGDYVGRDNISFFGPESLDNFKKLAGSISQPVDKARDFIPELAEGENKIVVFMYRSQEGSDLWRDIDAPEWLIRGSDSDLLSRKVAELLVARTFRTPTYSSLLHYGMVNFLVTRDVFQSARKVLTEGKWRSLKSILIGTSGGDGPKMEAAAFVGFLAKEYGAEKFVRVWFLTTPIGGSNSLDSALDQVVGNWLDQVEEKLKTFLRSDNTQPR
ncbi:hypothetical protein KGY79_00435 [Candidatus Bipolaricaulota bacterium]|nr:hypothetical protein [Candidatus Bipolaricaulota bacterium]